MAGGRAAVAGGGRPESTVHVFVDYDALMRGETLEGENCEIPGLGPIPVSAARRMADDCILNVIVTKGVDITGIAHAGRTVPAHLRTALEARDPKCIAPGCDMRRGLQIDHREPHACGGKASMQNSARLCLW